MDNETKNNTSGEEKNEEEKNIETDNQAEGSSQDDKEDDDNDNDTPEKDIANTNFGGSGSDTVGNTDDSRAIKKARKLRRRKKLGLD